MQIEEYLFENYFKKGLEFKRILFPTDTIETVTNTNLSVFSCTILKYVLYHVMWSTRPPPQVDFI